MSRIETLLAHSGTEPDPETGAISPPVHMATNYESTADGSYDRGYKYGRMGNPTRDRFQKVMAELESADTCFAFSSGMAASAAVLNSLRPGDEVVFSDDLYVGVSTYARIHFGRWGGRVNTFDAGDLSALSAAMSSSTSLVWIETPSNPGLGIIDIREAASIAHEADALLVVDSTFSTPLLTKPLDLGADIIIHSVTKYLAGHSDALGGVVLMRRQCELSETIQSLHQVGGAVMDPFTAWLAMRGIRSLGARMKMICENASEIAHWLQQQKNVIRVRYPGLADHPGHDIANRQMSDFGGMISFQVQGGAAQAHAVVGKARVFTRATSLGGTESLIEHRRTAEGPESTTPGNLIRLSIGLEHPGDLIADLERALCEVYG